MRNHFREERFVLFFRVLLIEDAVLLVTESNAAEAVLTCLAAIAVAHVIAKPHVAAEGHVDAATRHAATPELFTARPAGAVAGVNVLRIIEGNRIRTIFALVSIETIVAVLAIKEMIPLDVLAIRHSVSPMNRLERDLTILLPRFFPGCKRSTEAFRTHFLVLLFGARFIEEMIALIDQIAAEEAVIAAA